MKIDVTKLLTNQASTINIDESVDIPSELLNGSRIDLLKDIKVQGKVSINEDNLLIVNAKITGKMILKDDLTLEPVEYPFDTVMEEELSDMQNTIDITDIVWQNILVEVPSKVRATDEDINMSGDGWRLISEEQFNEERNRQNNPFANLGELLKTKEDK